MYKLFFVGTLLENIFTNVRTFLFQWPRWCWAAVSDPSFGQRLRTARPAIIIMYEVVIPLCSVSFPSSFSSSSSSSSSSSYLRKLALRACDRELELSRSHPLLGMREGMWGRLDYVPDGTNPAFSRAILHGTVIIDLLTKLVVFGPFPGCRRAVPWRGFQSPSGGIFGGCLRTFGKHFSGSGLQPELCTKTNET